MHKPTEIQTDVVVSGGGIAGLCAAAAFGRQGFNVICVDPAPPVTDATHANADMRSTALLQPARELLQTAGLWERLAAHASPLQVMRIVDAGGAAPNTVKEFNAADMSDQPFGWNVPNWLLRREFLAALDALDTVDFRPGVATTSLFTRTAYARVGLSDGSRVRAKLVIAADGRNSAMRDAAGIDVQTYRYGQKALAFTVSHLIPHENVSTEIHKTGGPFTLVPLPDQDGLPASAVVWMDDGAKCLARQQSDIAEFEQEMSNRSDHLFGPLSLTSHRSIWPIISQKASRLTSERLALVAEAAHVVPPIGAQGLNMSLADTASLLSLACASRDTLGDTTMLEAYHKARYPDISMRVQGIDLLNRTSQFENQLMRDIRAAGLTALHQIKPVRKRLMALGLGVK